MNDITIQYQLANDPLTGEIVGAAMVSFPSGQHLMLTARASRALFSRLAHSMTRHPDVAAISRVADQVAADHVLGHVAKAAQAVQSGAVVGTGWWFSPQQRGLNQGDRFRANTDDAQAMQQYMRSYQRGETAYLEHEEPSGVQAALNKVATRIASDAEFAALQWSKLAKKNRDWIRNKYQPKGFKGFTKDAGKAIKSAVPAVADYIQHGPIIGPLLQVAPGLRKTVDAVEKALPVPGAAQLHGLGEQARALVNGKHAADVAKELIRQSPALANAANVVKAANAGDPHALAYVAQLATAAKSGHPPSKAAIALFAALNTPVSKLAAAPGAVLPARAAPVVPGPAPKKLAASWINARPMLQGGDPGKPNTWPKWMRDDYNAAIESRDPSVLGVAASMRPYAFLNRYGAAVASGAQMNGAAVGARLALYHRLRSGDPEVRAALTALAAQADAGNPRAKAFMAGMQEVVTMPGTISGAGVSNALAPAFRDSAAMSLHNYYQIAGTGGRYEVVPDMFYAGCAAAAGCVVPTVQSGAAYPVRPRQALDLVIGAGGQALTRRWDGFRWVWTEHRAA